MDPAARTAHPAPIDAEYFLLLKRLVALEEAEEREELLRTFSELTPKERELRGRALLGLTLITRHFDAAEHVLLVFGRHHRQPLPLFTLEVGDLDGLFPEGGAGEEAAIGTVYEKTRETITVAFRPPLPEWIEQTPRLELHQSVNRVTYQRMHDALDAVSQAGSDTRLGWFRDISLGKDKPAIEPVPLVQIVWHNPGLNASQRDAVRCALSAQDVAVIHGPPGTGKTTVLIEIIRQCVRHGQSVLVNAPSNTACDHILGQLIAAGVNTLRLGHPARVDVPLREHTLDFKLALHPVGQRLTQAQRELYALFRKQERGKRRGARGESAHEVREAIASLKQEARSLRREVFQRVMEEAQVVVGTLTSIELQAMRRWPVDVVVIDEASQALEPLTWIPIARAQKIIMAGDHCQLPPVIRSTEAESKGLGTTLFERFHRVLGSASTVLLERQYRMHERIMGFSSQMFYHGRLVADESVRTHTLADLPGVQATAETREPLVFVDTAGKGFEERLEEGSQSRYNPEEGELALSLLRAMLEAGVPAADIAVISPYSAQVRWLVGRSPDPQIEIDSVDGFQGREKELVLVSLVRSNVEGELGFLADTRRMNVAMTRARRKLIVVGDSGTLAAIPFYQAFIRYAEQVGGYRSAWEL